MSEPALRLSRQQWDDTTKLATGLVALGDWIEEMLTAMMTQIAAKAGVDATELPPLPPMPEAIEKLRLRALQTSRQEELERVTERMAATRRLAFRASKVPAPIRYEQESPGDGTSWGRNAERDRLLANGQAAKHMQMARIGEIFVGDGSDAHLASRKIREEIYAKLAQEAEGD